MKMSSPNKVSATQNQTRSPAASVKKEMSTPNTLQSTQSRGPESQRQASPASAQKITPETQRTSGLQKPDQTNQNARRRSSASPVPQQQSGGSSGFTSAKTETAKPEESVTGKMFGFGSSIFSSASTLIASAVQDDPKTTPPVSPKRTSENDSKPPPVQKSVQDKKQEQPHLTAPHPAGQANKGKAPSETSKDAAASKADHSACPLCKMALNVGSKDPPNYNTCTACKSIVCNQCGFNPMPNVKEVRHM